MEMDSPLHTGLLRKPRRQVLLSSTDEEQDQQYGRVNEVITSSDSSTQKIYDYSCAEGSQSGTKQQEAAPLGAEQPDSTLQQVQPSSSKSAHKRARQSGK